MYLPCFTYVDGKGGFGVFVGDKPVETLDKAQFIEKGAVFSQPINDYSKIFTIPTRHFIKLGVLDRILLYKSGTSEMSFEVSVPFTVSNFKFGKVKTLKDLFQGIVKGVIFFNHIESLL